MILKPSYSAEAPHKLKCRHFHPGFCGNGQENVLSGISESTTFSRGSIGSKPEADQLFAGVFVC